MKIKYYIEIINTIASIIFWLILVYIFLTKDISIIIK